MKHPMIEKVISLALKTTQIRWPNRVKTKGTQAEYYLEKDGICKNGVVDFVNELTLSEALEEIASRLNVSPDDKDLKISKFR